MSYNLFFVEKIKRTFKNIVDQLILLTPKSLDPRQSNAHETRAALQ